MKKYTLDTSVIIHDPDCFFKFEENMLYIPKAVLDELDGLKNATGEKGMFARMAQKNIEKILVDNNTNIMFVSGFNSQKNDDDIVETARHYNTILVSRDVGMRIKANLYGVPAEEYNYAKVREDYTGYQIHDIQDNWFINRIYAGHNPHIDELGITAVENEFIVLKYASQSVMTICKDGILYKVDNHEPYKIVGKNVEQKLALHALMDPTIQLITLTGSAGSGKAQPLYSKILTPTGWTTMGKVYVGMEISTPDGTAKILGIFPQGPKAIYKITTKSYKTVECCLEHLWYIKQLVNNCNYTLLSNTKDIAEKVVSGIPVYIPYMHENNMLWEEILKVEYIGIQEAQCIYINSKDHLYITDDCIVTHNTLLSLAAALAQKEKYKQILLTRPVVPLSGKDLGFLPGPQPLDAKVLGINGWTTMGDLKVGDKVIAASTGLPVDVLGIFPKGKKDIYKITTIDGESTECCIDHLWCVKTEKELNTLNSEHIVNTREIINNFNNIYYIPIYKNNSLVWKKIYNIQLSSIKEAQCILIDDSQHLYITDDYIVTHNTLNEKLDPYNGPFGDNFAVLHGGDPEKANQINKLKQDEKIKVEAMPYIRGRSFNKVMLVADECFTGDTQILTVDGYKRFDQLDGTEKIFQYDENMDVSEVIPSRLICKDYDGDLITFSVKNFSMTATAKHRAVLYDKNRRIVFKTFDEDFEGLDILAHTPEQRENLFLLFNTRDGIKTRTHFTGKVYCVTVPTGIICVKQGDNIYFTGNCQNMTKHEVKTLVTRAGNDTKIILTGDVKQIDTPYMDEYTNGLSYLISRMKGQPIYAHITMQKSERSPLAELAANLL